MDEDKPTEDQPANGHDQNRRHEDDNGLGYLIEPDRRIGYPKIPSAMIPRDRESFASQLNSIPSTRYGRDRR